MTNVKIRSGILHAQLTYLEDINKIIDKDNTIMVKYNNDIWGNPKIIDKAQTTISSLLATYNPFLFKWYIFDSETGYYYLNS